MAQAGQPAAVRVGAARSAVAHLDHEPVAVAVRAHPGGRAAGVLGGVRQRLGGDEVRGGLDDRRRPLADLGLHRHGDRGAAAEPLERGGQAAVGEHRGRDAARQVAQLGDRRAGLLARLPQQLGQLGLVVEAGLRAAEVHAQRDEPCLRTVVQVALDPAQLGGLDVDRAAARAG